ncbi:hypothetical protein VST7929_01820 [Vibrio stylophorae]|uniref:NAD(P)-binding domain-containing protein n=1 Tax=Vibrio stylophorae TaxID=659351 RepID=A0ABM8ZUF9_9VIBR|nr:NAD(P)H-binding protein [Vibrio stylophorae]CAH0533943.1 hypothetical protein VST7929_01820 [Vibrio stylophorae]
MKEQVSWVIAGATGLVGQAVLEATLNDDSVSQVHTLTRRALSAENNKLKQWISDDLQAPVLSRDDIAPSVGVIALGTTIKKAGSKANFYAVDVDLVAHTAKVMQRMGVTHLFVVSCIGANPRAFSHYLRCKGQMEAKVQSLCFSRLTFLHPGPLAGERSESRKDEVLVQGLLKVLRPVMKGSLMNYQPIEAKDMAKAVLSRAKHPSTDCVEYLTASQMMQLARA